MDPCGPKIRKIDVQGLFDSRNDTLYDTASGTHPYRQASPLPQKQHPVDVDGETTERHVDDDGDNNAGAAEEPISKKIEDFSEVVSIVGLRYAFVRDSSKAKRLIWLILVLFGAGFMIYQINDRLVTYLLWPTTVDLRIQYNATLRFPSVTICNENRMSYSAASKLGIINLAAVFSHSLDLNNTR